MSLTEKATSNLVSVAPWQIHYHEAGEGPVVLFVHGSGPGAGGWSNFVRNLDHFAKSYRVIALDLPNFGRSSKVEVPVTGVYSYYSQVILQFLDVLQIPSVSLIGNSLGGGISIKVTLDQPERVQKLVLMGSGGGLPLISPTPSEGIKAAMHYYEPPGPSKDKLREFLQMMVYDSASVTEELVEQRYQASIQADIVPLITKSRPPGQERLFPRLGEIGQPTLLLWGRDDRAVSLDNAFIMLKLMRNVRLHVFSECGHWVQWEKATEFNNLVSEFLKPSS